MNRRDIFIGLAGACLGMLAGFWVTTKKYEDRLNAEIKLTEQLIDEVNRKEKVIVDTHKDPSIQEISEMTYDKQKEVVDKIVDVSKYRPKVNYDEINVEGEHSYKDRVDPSEIQSPPEGCDYARDAYVISFEEFCEGVQGFGQETITYYAGDDTLADFNEDIIDDRSGVIGDEALTNFGAEDDSEVVYVRNEALSCDYDIVKHPGKYKEVVCGMFEEE